MKKAVALILVLVFLVASPSFADFGTDGLLSDIFAALQTVDGFLADINTVLDETHRHLNDIWPESTLQQIGYYFNEAKSIRQQIDSLACGWNFSLRTQKLWQGLFGGVHFCKPEFRMIYGAPPEGYDADLEEYYDYSANLRMRELSDWVAETDGDEADAMWLINEAEKGRATGDPNDPYGPGYSQRLSAIGAARVAKQLEKNMNIGREELRLLEERSDELRFRRRKEKDLSLLMVAFATGREPFSNLPLSYPTPGQP